MWCLKYFDLKKCAQHHKKCSRFYGGPFLWSIFRAGVAEQSHCLLHVKELKVTKTELKRQIGD